MKWIGARRLAAAEQVDQPGEGRVHRRRHRQAGEHQQRTGDDRRRDRRASAARCSAAPPRPWGSAAARDRRSRAECFEIVAGSATGGECGRAAAGRRDRRAPLSDQRPGEEEVPAPADGEILRLGQRRPGREPVRRQRQQRPGEIGRLAEIERRMGVEDLQPAHQQREEAAGVDPVTNPRQCGMAQDDPLGGGAEGALGCGHDSSLRRARARPVSTGQSRQRFHARRIFRRR